MFRIKTKIWRIRIFWRFRCREQVNRAVNSKFVCAQICNTIWLFKDSQLVPTRQHWTSFSISAIYRISANSFRGNYSFLNLALFTVTFDLYLINLNSWSGNYSSVDTIHWNMVSEFFLYQAAWVESNLGRKMIIILKKVVFHSENRH